MLWPIHLILNHAHRSHVLTVLGFANWVVDSHNTYRLSIGNLRLRLKMTPTTSHLLRNYIPY